MRTMVDLFMFADPPAASNWIQIMKTGKWDHQQHGQIEITPADLHQFKDNFDQNVRGVKLFVDVSHKPDDGAVAQFEELKVEGDKLFAKVNWTAEGAKLIKSGKYRYFSPEFMFQWKDPENGNVHKNVLFGGAITNRPFLKGMDPIELSEDETFAIYFAEQEIDPDHDGDDDRTTDPKTNPDWMDDVKHGWSPWPADKPEQVKQLQQAGITKEAADKARASFLEKQSKDKKSQQERSQKHGIGVKEGGNVTKPAEFSDVPDDEFADPVNFKYPISPDYALAGYRYFSAPRNQEQYTLAERKVIAQRIVDRLPEKAKAEAIKVFQLDEPASHKNNEPGGGSNNMNKDVVSMTEHKAALDRLQRLEEENRRIKMSDTVNGFLFNENTKKGKIMPASHDKVLELMMGMSDDQVAKFTEIVKELPDVISFGDEVGHGGAGTTKTRDDLIIERADVLMNENKNLDYKQALLMADREIPIR